MERSEIIFTILVWLAVVAVFFYYRWRNGLELKSPAGNHPERLERNDQPAINNKTT